MKTIKMKTVTKYILVANVKNQYDGEFIIKSDKEDELIYKLYKDPNALDLLYKFTNWNYVIYSYKQFVNQDLGVTFNITTDSLWNGTFISYGSLLNSSLTLELGNPIIEFKKEPYKSEKTLNDLKFDFQILMTHSKIEKLIEESEEFEKVKTRRIEIQKHEKELAEMATKKNKNHIRENNLNQLSYLMKKYKDDIEISVDGKLNIIF